MNLKLAFNFPLRVKRFDVNFQIWATISTLWVFHGVRNNDNWMMNPSPSPPCPLFAIPLWEILFHLLMVGTKCEGSKFANITGKLSCSGRKKHSLDQCWEPPLDGHALIIFPQISHFSAHQSLIAECIKPCESRLSRPDRQGGPYWTRKPSVIVQQNKKQLAWMPQVYKVIITLKTILNEVAKLRNVRVEGATKYQVMYPIPKQNMFQVINHL